MRDWLVGEIKVRRDVTQIYNGIDTEAFSPGDDGFRIRRRMGIQERAFVIGIVSRLDPIKDHLTLFTAFNGLKKSYPDLRLLVIGDGPARQKLESLSGEGIDFLGPRLDIAELLRCLDLFVLPSLNEGISNAILEAMASGLPVVATRAGGNPELVKDGETGILFNPGDIQGIASAIFSYMKDGRQRRIHGTSGRSMARRHFGVEAMVKSYEKVYERVANV
jgi:glycosyltransferase involved in cell wall biosynthesis